MLVSHLDYSPLISVPLRGPVTINASWCSDNWPAAECLLPGETPLLPGSVRASLEVSREDWADFASGKPAPGWEMCVAQIEGKPCLGWGRKCGLQEWSFLEFRYFVG